MTSIIVTCDFTARALCHVTIETTEKLQNLIKSLIVVKRARRVAKHIFGCVASNGTVFTFLKNIKVEIQKRYIEVFVCMLY